MLSRSVGNSMCNLRTHMVAWSCRSRMLAAGCRTIPSRWLRERSGFLGSHPRDLELGCWISQAGPGAGAGLLRFEGGRQLFFTRGVCTQMQFLVNLGQLSMHPQR